jgi:hypothetical protein
MALNHLQQFTYNNLPHEAGRRFIPRRFLETERERDWDFEFSKIF